MVQATDKHNGPELLLEPVPQPRQIESAPEQNPSTSPRLLQGMEPDQSLLVAPKQAQSEAAATDDLLKNLLIPTRSQAPLGKPKAEPKGASDTKGADEPKPKDEKSETPSPPPVRRKPSWSPERE